MKIIVTGVTEMVGEGVLLACPEGVRVTEVERRVRGIRRDRATCRDPGEFGRAPLHSLRCIAVAARVATFIE
jgi:hypothetical protein